ncbi:MAG: iron-sulfur cluster assembly protein [Planctomycetota bacterium]
MNDQQPSPTVPPAANQPAPAASPAPSSIAAPATAPVSPPQQAAPAPPAPGKKPSLDELREALKEVYDPEIPINIVDLGLVYKIEEHDGVVDVELTLTSPHCPLGYMFQEQVHETLRNLPGISAVNVKLVFEPLWTKEMMTADGKLQASMLGFM